MHLSGMYVNKSILFFPYGSTVLGEPRPSHVGWRFDTVVFDIWQDSLDERSARRKASTYTRQQNTERRGQTSMPRAVFEPTIPVSKRSVRRPRPRGNWDRRETALLFQARRKWNQIVDKIWTEYFKALLRRVERKEQRKEDWKRQIDGDGW
jgi:hypothetical protein